MMLSRRTKITLYKVLVRPVAFHDYDAWTTTKTDENKLATFERMVLKRIFGPRSNIRGEFELRRNQEVEELYDRTNIIGIFKSSRLEWAGHMWSSERPRWNEYKLETRHKKAETWLNR